MDLTDTIYGEPAWEERYRSSPQNWSGNPNPVLVTEVAGLAPGTQRNWAHHSATGLPR
jgi:hypothetical protein